MTPPTALRPLLADEHAAAGVLDVLIPAAGQTFGRVFNAARAGQGFRGQEHLDAFYAHLDHTRGCTDCRPGAVLLDDGWQGTVVECGEAQRLFAAECAALGWDH